MKWSRITVGGVAFRPLKNAQTAAPGGRAGSPTRDPLSVGMACDEFAGRSRSLLGGKLSRERRHGHEKLAVTEHYIVLMRYGMNG